MDKCTGNEKGEQFFDLEINEYRCTERERNREREREREKERESEKEMGGLKGANYETSIINDNDKE